MNCLTRWLIDKWVTFMFKRWDKEQAAMLRDQQYADEYIYPGWSNER